MHMMYGYGSIWPYILMIVTIVILVSFGVFLVTHYTNSKQNLNEKQSNYHSSTQPLQILQERLAKGEIDEAEYKRLKSIIENDQK